MKQEKESSFIELEAIDITQDMKEHLSNEKVAKNTIVKVVLKYMFIFVLFGIVIPRYVCVQVRVEGFSMSDTLQNSDILLQEKISYHFKEPERFDIVILNSPLSNQMEEERYWVKRIIGLPGETIEIKNGVIYINGEQLKDDQYGNSKIEYYGIIKESYTIPEDEYFVMGDNRRGIESHDSRYSDVKSIKRKDIQGHVFARIYPLNTITLFD